MKYEEKEDKKEVVSIPKPTGSTRCPVCRDKILVYGEDHYDEAIVKYCFYQCPRKNTNLERWVESDQAKMYLKD